MTASKVSIVFSGLVLGSIAAFATGTLLDYTWGPTFALLIVVVAMLAPGPARGLASVLAEEIEKDITTLLHKGALGLLWLVAVAFFAWFAALAGLDLRDLFPAFVIGWGWTSVFGSIVALIFLFGLCVYLSDPAEEASLKLRTVEELVEDLERARDTRDEPFGFLVIEELSGRTRDKPDLKMSLVRELMEKDFHYAPLVLMLERWGKVSDRLRSLTIIPVCECARRTPGFPKGLGDEFDTWLRVTVGAGKLEPPQVQALKELAAHFRTEGNQAIAARIEKHLRR